MKNNVKVSNLQMGLVLIGFLFGDFVLLNPSKVALQDAWLAIILGWIGGLILIGIYIYIYLLNPEMTLVEILRTNLGRYISSVIIVLYIWYFIHLASLITRSVSEYMVTVNYAETPLVFIMIITLSVIAFDVLAGFEIKGRIAEITVPIIIAFTITLYFAVGSLYQPSNLLPFLENGLKPVLKTGFVIVTFPFGEAVAFLMLFAFINDKNKLLKSSFISVSIVGVIFLASTLMDIMVLSPQMFSRQVFPAHTVSSLIPSIIIEPIVSINLMMAGGIQIGVFIHAACYALAQFFYLDDYKPLVIPVITLVGAISIWIYDSLPQLFRIAAEIYPYYAVPFQIVFPIIILVVSLIKKRKKAEKKGEGSTKE